MTCLICHITKSLSSLKPLNTVGDWINRARLGCLYLVTFPCSLYVYNTPEPLYNTVRYNTVLDITRIRVGPQIAILDSFCYITYAFYSHYNTVWIANMEIVLDPNNSVIKRLWYTGKEVKHWSQVSNFESHLAMSCKLVHLTCEE